MDKLISPSVYNLDYFESGIVTGVSGYMNYSWMPELTLRMVYYMAKELPLEPDQTILDYGCAKGFIVKALRILDFEAYGVDLSDYAITQADGQVRDFCRLITGGDDENLFERRYDWMISKDVFEHIHEPELRTILERATMAVDKIFVVVPVAADDVCNEYIIPEYNRDATHVIAKSIDWWRELFQSSGWKVARMSTEFPGCKENWTSRWKDGNAFFILSRE